MFEERGSSAARRSSVIVKSFAVSPSTGLPFLSFTATVSTTKLRADGNLYVPGPPGRACLPVC